MHHFLRIIFVNEETIAAYTSFIQSISSRPSRRKKNICFNPFLHGKLLQWYAQNLPTTEGLVTLFLRANIQDDVPEYASLYFAGGATSWGADPCAMTRLGDTNVYYIQLALDSKVKEYDSYKVGFGYNDKLSEESVRCGNIPGIDWDYVATECGSNLQFVWDGKNTLVDLGVFTFNKMLTDGDLANWIVTGSFADWATTTDNADYIFTKANNFTVSLELHTGDEFKFKRNEEGWDNYYLSPDIKGPSNYVSIDEDGTIRAVHDCKVWITLSGVYTFNLSLVNVESE